MEFDTDIIILIALLFGVFFFIRSYFSQAIKVYDDPILSKIYQDLKKIYPDIDKKGIHLYGANDTLTENKKKIFICVKRRNGEYYDYNTILYISVHELAHVLNNEYDITENHGAKFNDINNQLLNKAYELGLLDKTKPINYDMCGLLK